MKMRLALGFCGQFAKATLSSLSYKPEVGLQIEVRRPVFCSRLGHRWCFIVLFFLWMLWFHQWERFVQKSGNTAPLSSAETFSLMIAEEPQKFHSFTSNCITFAPHLRSFFQLYTYFILCFQRSGSGCEAGAVVCWGGEERRGKLGVN